MAEDIGDLREAQTGEGDILSCVFWKNLPWHNSNFIKMLEKYFFIENIFFLIDVNVLQFDKTLSIYIAQEKDISFVLLDIFSITCRKN